MIKKSHKVIHSRKLSVLWCKIFWKEYYKKYLKLHHQHEEKGE